MNVSYKPQKISPKSTGTVRQLLHNKIRDSYIHPQFITDVIKPLQVESIMDQEVQNLSGGELQRVALTMALGKVHETRLEWSWRAWFICLVCFCSLLIFI